MFGDPIPDSAVPENKRKERNEDQSAPEGRRRRIQEEEDWYDDSWTNAGMPSRDIGLVERYEIEDRVE
eukprot:12109245-Karenia_brevis.AAC.1